MKEKEKTAVSILSAAAFFMLLSLHAKQSVMNCLCAGLLAGAALSFICGEKEAAGPPAARMLVLLSALLSVPVLWASVARFAGTWPDSRLLASISVRLFSGAAPGALILGLLLAAAAVPFVLTAIALMLHFVIRGFGTVRCAVLWAELASGGNARRAGRTVGMMLLRLFAAALVGTLLLAAVYALPVRRMDDHVRQSAGIIDDEWAYPVLSPYFTSQLDNYTEAIILLEAADPAADSMNVLNRAMTAPRGKISGLATPADELVAHYVKGVAYDSVNEYARYWHGNLVFVKPLLLLLDYGALRWVNGVCQVLLLAGICILMKKNRMGRFILPTLLAYGMLMPLALAKSLQFSSCFYVLAIGTAALLTTGKARWKLPAPVIFLYTGIATAYFDLLTYPIATFGVPALFFLLLHREDPEERNLAGLVKNGVSWCFGFGGIWVMKWVLGSAVTGSNVLADGAAAFAKRASYTATENVVRVDAISCLRMNYEAFFFTPVTFFAAAFLLWLLWKRAKKNRGDADRVRLLFPFFLVGLAPVVWYLFAANHSTVHCYFTNKACVVSFLALLFGAAAVGEKEPGKPDSNSQLP